MRGDADQSSEAGMTLIELMIAIALLGVIIVPVTSVFLLGLLESDSTRERITDSNGAQLTSAFILGDIQSSRLVQLSASACLPSDFDSSSDVVQLQLGWWDPAQEDSARTASPDHLATYVERPSASGDPRLYRYYCEPSSTMLVTPLVQNVVATASGGDPFVVECDVASPTGVADSCAATTPAQVHIAVTAKSTQPSNESSYAPFTFEVQGERRVSNGI
jgi:prepilin-type N-terminal cleavage/methylation domain-containing protein